MGTRWILTNCFGMRRPKRAPTPPAGMTTVTRAAIPASSAEHRPPWCPDGRLRDEGLQLEQHRPRALETRDDDRAGRLRRAFGEEEPGGVLHLDESPLRHLEDADLVRGAESVFHSTENAIR